jgi:hypothetical protein
VREGRQDTSSTHLAIFPATATTSCLFTSRNLSMGLEKTT